MRVFPAPRLHGEARHVVDSAGRCSLESLERRRLLSAAAAAPIGGTFVSTGSAATTVDLSAAFTDPALTQVRLTTNVGPIDLGLTPQATPGTVANFLRYVNGGLYDDTLVHRLVPGFVIQGGGYGLTGAAGAATAPHIRTFGTIPSEFSPTRPNVAGTIAMALSGGPPANPDSAATEWFINLGDNSGSLDSDAASGTFTVFGSVINGTMSTVNRIAALARADGAPLDPNLAAAANGGPIVPVLNPVPPASVQDPANLVVVRSAAVLPESSLFTFSAASDNNALVAPVVSGSTLTLNYPTAGATGTARVTVTATEAGGAPVTQTFLASVGSAPVTIGAGTAAARGVVFTDAAGRRQTVRLSGPGTADVVFSGAGIFRTPDAKAKSIAVTGTGVFVAGISTIGTTARSALKFAAARGTALPVSGITTDGPIGSISGPAVTLTGSLTAAGVVGKLSLGAVTGGNLSLGGAAAVRATTALTLGSLDGATLTASVPLASITVRGGVTNSTISLTAAGTQDLAKLTVAGSITGTRIDAAGGIGSISAAALTGSRAYAGVAPADGAALPVSQAGFAATAFIASVKARSFTGSDLAAYLLGRLSLGAVHLSNSGTPFGIATHALTSLSAGTDAGGRLRLRKVGTAADLTAQLARNRVSLSGTDLTIAIV